MEAFSGGVMLYMSLFDLMPEAAAVVGVEAACVGLACGALLFWAMSRLVPDPGQPFSNVAMAYLSSPSSLSSQSSTLPSSDIPRNEVLVPQDRTAAVLTRRTATGLPEDDDDSEREADGGEARHEQREVACPKGACFDSEASGEDEDSGDGKPSGSGIQAPLVPNAGRSTPSTTSGEKDEKQQRELQRLQFFRTALVTTLGICIHNFPEGVALYLSTLKGLR